MFRQGSNWVWRSLNYLFPPACVVCQETILEPGRLRNCCATCAGALDWRDIDLTCIYFRPKSQTVASVKGIYCLAPCFYQGSINHLLRLFKFHAITSLSTFLGSLLTDLLRRRCSATRVASGYVLTPEVGHWRDLDLIVPIPLHPKRQRERGYNQALLLAAQVADELGLNLHEKILTRSFATARQTQQGTALARWLNVQSAFEVVAPQLVAGKNILLVDDITTTGSTLIVAAERLRAAGAKSVTGLVVASEH